MAIAPDYGGFFVALYQMGRNALFSDLTACEGKLSLNDVKAS